MRGLEAFWANLWVWGFGSLTSCCSMLDLLRDWGLGGLLLAGGLYYLSVWQTNHLFLMCKLRNSRAHVGGRAISVQLDNTMLHNNLQAVYAEQPTFPISFLQAQLKTLRLEPQNPNPRSITPSRNSKPQAPNPAPF